MAQQETDSSALDVKLLTQEIKNLRGDVLALRNVMILHAGMLKKYIDKVEK